MAAHTRDVTIAILLLGLFNLSLAPRISTILTAPNEVENEHHECDDEQDMDKPAGDMKRESTAPKEQQKNGNNE